MAFGWLLIAPTDAHSDDPLAVAAQEIQSLKDSVDDLSYKDELNSLIGIAEEKYNIAYSAKAAQDSATAAYNSAVEAKATALHTLFQVP